MIKVNFLKTIKTQSSVLLVVSLILLMLTSVYIFSGCNIAGKTYTESNNGDNLNLKINDVITIRLESNATTGFKWNISNETDTGIASFLSSDYKQTSTDKELVGAGGYETFTFKAKSKGNAAIALTYNKPWEEGVAPLKTFKINIDFTILSDILLFAQQILGKFLYCVRGTIFIHLFQFFLLTKKPISVIFLRAQINKFYNIYLLSELCSLRTK